MSRILVTKEIADRLGCSERTVRRRYSKGQLPGAFKLDRFGSPIKMKEVDLFNLIRRHETVEVSE